MSKTTPDGPLVLYDGDCGFCQGSVRFLLRHERDKEIRFAALGSPTGQAALSEHGIRPDFAKSVVLIEKGHAYLYSTAVVRVAKHLKWPWRLAVAGGVLPRPVRDLMYRFVARVRGHLPGNKLACGLPEPAARERFIDTGRCGL